jgi:CDGSH-type Zn-finger protein
VDYLILGLPASSDHAGDINLAIEDIPSLRQHLQWAIELEHSTLPPYLCALYSIKQGTNPEATEILRSIFMEEMLHMTLAANLLNAVGGSPQIDKPGFLPAYPLQVPHSRRQLVLPLAKFSRATVAGFMSLERPESNDALLSDDLYETIGEFYHSIELGLIELCQRYGENAVFCGDLARQILPDTVIYQGSGRIVPVQDLSSALAALEEIVDQGEGLDHSSIWDGDRNMFHHEREEVGHFFRLEQILAGRYYRRGDTPQSGPSGERFAVDWDAVHDIPPNPRPTDYPMGSQVRQKMAEHSRIYTRVLKLLHRAFNGDPSQLDPAATAMFESRQLAIELMQLPSGQSQTAAGPAFEYLPEPAEEGPFRLEPLIQIRPGGPYLIAGGVPLVRKTPIYTELDEAIAWRTDPGPDVQGTYALCRCGQSANKPFCDGSHAKVGFEGTETADSSPTDKRQKVYAGSGIRIKGDPMLCVHARFCFNRVANVTGMLPDSADVRTRTQLVGMIEHCPSGALAYELPDDPDEPDGGAYQSMEPALPEAIGIVKDGPLWVTGGLRIERADGRPVERRNRITLCRCGQSKNKPYCDGTHGEVGFCD